MKSLRRKSKEPNELAKVAPPRQKRESKKPAVKRGGKKGTALGARGQRFVLIVGDEGGILVFMEGKKVSRRLFAPSPQPDHTATIVELMRSHPKVPLFILSDVLDQQYVRQSFPPVSSLSVGGLVKRRLDRDFAAEDMKGSISLGRDKTGRKEWNVLLIALANTPLMQQWLSLIVELPNEFRGVYLTPVESQNYIPTLKRYLPGQPPATPWQLLVTHNKVSGFRQVVLRDGKLVFTRATLALDDAVSAVIAGNIEQEIINTLEYLRRLGFQDNATLEIIVIAAQEVKEAIDVKRFNAANAVVLTPLEVAEATGLEQAALSADRFGDVVMAACFAQTKKHVLRFQTAYAKQLAQFYTIRRSVFALAALACVGMAFLAFSDMVSAISDRSEASTVEGKRQPVLADLANAKKSIASLDVDVAKKSAIVAAYDAYMKDTKTPLQFVADLAPFISAEHRIALLTWAPKAPSAAGAPSATGEGGEGGNAAEVSKSSVQITLDMEFLHPFEDVDALSKAVTTYISDLKNNMPNYNIGTGAFPWLVGGGDKGMEISFDKEEKSALREGMNKIQIYFWPKTEAKPKPEAAQPSAGAAHE